MLKVQEFLKNGGTIEDLKEKFGITANIYKDKLVNLNYDQIESPKTDPIVIECRSLILEIGTWDIVSMAFKRFFNYGECLEQTTDFNYVNAVALEKVDGSIISLFKYDGEWIMSTRKLIGGSGPVSFCSITFADLFESAIVTHPNFWENIIEGYNYIFELVSPMNKVVKSYDKPALYLLGMRDVKSWDEMPNDFVESIARKIGVNAPYKVSFKNSEDIVKLSRSMARATDEGFVCVDYTSMVDGCFPRIKVKNPSYVALAHIKESAASSIRGFVQVVTKNEQDELLAVFPEYKPQIDFVVNRWEKFKKDLADIEDKIEPYISKEALTGEERKECAIIIQKSGSCQPYLFSKMSKKCTDINDFLDQMATAKCAKAPGRFMVEALNITENDLKKFL